MKKILLLGILALAASSALADATLTFVTSGVGATEFTGPFVFDTDGTTKLDNGFKGQIYAGTDAGNLAAVGSAESFGLFSGTPNAAANGTITSGTSLTVTGVADGASGFYQLRAWDGTHSTFAAAQTAGAKFGSSDVVAVTFGGGLAAGPNVQGFQSFSLVPEPGTMTLGLLGLGGLIASRRRKNA